MDEDRIWNPSSIQESVFGKMTREFASLDPKMGGLVKLFCLANAKRWNLIPGCAQEALEAGASPGEIRSTLRQLVMSSGYGATLKAFLVLKGAGQLPPPFPGKVGGLPGDAWIQVYKNRSNKVKQVMHEADETLHDWMLLHAYGDVMSSPGLDLASKELLMVSFLAVSDMPDQLFGHVLAAVQNGNTFERVKEAIQISFDLYQGADKEELLKQAKGIVEKAFAHPECCGLVPDVDKGKDDGVAEYQPENSIDTKNNKESEFRDTAAKQPPTPPREFKMKRRLSSSLL